MTVQTLNVTTGVVAVGVTVASADNARSIEANVTSDGNLDLSGTGDALPRQQPATLPMQKLQAANWAASRSPC